MEKMANLGTVGFGLVADTASLEKSLEVVKMVEREYNRLAKLTSEDSQAMARHFAMVEGALLKIQSAAQNTTRKLGELGASKELVDQWGKSFQSAADTIGKSIDRADPNLLRRATVGVQEISKQAIAGAQQERQALENLGRSRAYLESKHAKAIADNMTLTSKARESELAFDRRMLSEAATLRQQETAAIDKSLSERIRAQERAQRQQTQTLQREETNRQRIVEQMAAANTRVFRQNTIASTGVTNLANRAQVAGVDPALVTNMQTALGTYTTASTESGRVQGWANLRHAMQAVNSEVTVLNSKGNLLVTVLRDLERAAIIAVGPLSGIGARLAVITALFDSTTFKAASLIVGVAGITTTLTIMSVQAVKATMDMQRFTALLTASTGAAQLVSQEFQNVKEYADKWGFSIRELVEPYAKFTTSARLSNLETEKTQKLFEAATVASRAMNLNSQRTGLVFLALEQMLSKGTVTMEELRRQLGDLLPGAFALTAQAMGVTQVQLNKMVRDGEVMARDMLPKLSQKLLDVFGPAAQLQAQNLQAQVNRLSTRMFEVWIAFDKAAGTSKIFSDILVILQRAAEGAAKHMDTFIRVLAALGGAGAGLAAITLLRALPAAFAAAAGALAWFNKELSTTAALTTLISRIAGWIPFLITLGAAATGAALGWKAMQPEIELASKSMDEFINQTEITVTMYKKLGEADKTTLDGLKKSMMTKLELLHMEIEMAQTRVRLAEVGKEKFKDTPNASAGMGRAAPFYDMAIGSERRKAMKEAEDANEELKKLLDNLAKLRKSFYDVMTGAIKETVGSEEQTATTKWENWVKGIQKHVRDLITTRKELNAAGEGKEAMRFFDAVKKADDILADIPKKAGSMGAITKALDDVGIPAGDLRVRLIALFEEMDKNNAKIQGFQQGWDRYKSSMNTLGEVFENTRERLSAALGSDPEVRKQQKQLEGDLNKIRDALLDIGMDQQGINEYLKIYQQLWNQMTGAEKQSDEIKKIRKELEALDNELGDKSQRSQERFNDQVTLIRRAAETGVISEAGANARIEQAKADHYRRQWEQVNEFGDKVRTVLNEMENHASKAFADIIMGGKTSWKDMLNTMLRDTLTWVTRMAVIRPLLRGLFGDVYDPKEKGGGLFGDILKKILNLPMKGGVTPSAVVNDPSFFIEAFHTGGIIGSSAKALRNVSPMAFMGAARYHSGGMLGLGPNEVPIIAEKGEGVFTRDQMSRMSKGNNYNITMHVHGVQDAQSFRASRSQIISDLGAAISRSRS